MIHLLEYFVYGWFNFTGNLPSRNVNFYNDCYENFIRLKYYKSRNLKRIV